MELAPQEHVIPRGELGEPVPRVLEPQLERGVAVAPSTIFRWVQRYVPEFEKRWARF